MRLYFAILIGRLIAFFTRTFKIGGGSAAPGYYALKIEPDLVKKLARKIPRNVIITGTNGKTTTARILAHLTHESNLKVIRNATGSNLERGIASALISHNSLFMIQDRQVASSAYDSNTDLGIWELDEAAFNQVAPKLKPNIVVFLNVFRDQMDRYGEIDSTVKKWQETISELPENTVILVNGDDANTLKLKDSHKGQVETFGVKDYKVQGESLEHTTQTKKPDFEANNIKTRGLEGSSFQFTVHSSQFTVELPIPGIYHIYDAVAAFAAASHLALPINSLTSSLVNFSPAFGRVEKLPFGYIFLIKNPAGATQVFETIAPQIKKEDRLLIALNDNFADGTDVSWIWDVLFEKFQISNFKFQIAASGNRAYDMAVRLKYAGFEPNQILVTPNLESALKEARNGLKGQLFILPTYTALLELQAILTKQGVKSRYWEGEI